MLPYSSSYTSDPYFYHLFDPCESDIKGHLSPAPVLVSIEDRLNSFLELGSDIHLHCASFLKKTDQLGQNQGAKNLTALSLTSKYFYEKIHNANVKGIIRAHKYHLLPIKIIRLMTVAALLLIGLNLSLELQDEKSNTFLSVFSTVLTIPPIAINLFKQDFVKTSFDNFDDASVNKNCILFGLLNLIACLQISIHKLINYYVLEMEYDYVLVISSLFFLNATILLSRACCSKKILIKILSPAIAKRKISLCQRISNCFFSCFKSSFQRFQ